MLIRWCKVFRSRTKKELKEALREIASTKFQTKLLKHVDKLSGDNEMVKIYTNLSRRELEYNTIMEEKIENAVTEAVEKATKEATEKGLKDGMKKGIRQRNIEIAKNLLDKNIDINVITSSTGLSKEEIEKLRES